MIDLFVDILNEAYAFVWYIFAMACNRLQLLTIFSECSILDVWKSSECLWEKGGFMICTQ